MYRDEAREPFRFPSHWLTYLLTVYFFSEAGFTVKCAGKTIDMGESGGESGRLHLTSTFLSDLNTTPSRTNLIAINSFWMVLDTVTSLVGGIFASALVARAFGPEQLGYYSYVMWMVTMTGIIGRVGLPVAVSRGVVQGFAEGNYSDVKALIFRLSLVQLAIALVLTIAGLTSLAYQLPAQYWGFAFIGVLATVPSMQLAIVSAANQAVENVGSNVIASLVSTFANLAGIFLTLYAGFGLIGLAASLLLSRIVDLVIRYWLYRRYFAPFFRMAGPPSTLTVKARRELIAFCMHSTVLQILSIVIWDRSETLFLKWFSPIAQLAFYSLPFSIVQQTSFFYRTFTSSAGISLLRRRIESPEGSEQMTGTMLRYTALVAFPITLGLAAVSPSLISVLYGINYLPAIPVLALASGFGAFRALVYPLEQLVIAENRQDLLIRALIISSVANVLLALALIPHFGAVGAATCNGLTQAFACWVAWRLFLKHFPMRMPWNSILRIVVASTIMAGFASLWTLATAPPVAVLLAGVLTGITVYPLALRWTGSIGQEDADRLSSLARLLPARGVRPVFSWVIHWITAAC
jgi:O-antigen/teichoic acid export membrane protein